MSMSSTSFTRAWCSISDEAFMQRTTVSASRWIVAGFAALLVLAPAWDAAARDRGARREARRTDERRSRGSPPVDENGCIGYIDGICVPFIHPGDAPLSLAPITRPDVGAAPRRLLVVLD